MRLFRQASATSPLLEQMGANVERTTALLHELIADWPDSSDRQGELVDLEHVGDRLVHDFVTELQAAKPSRDLLGLASRLDDIVDFAEEAGDLMVLYHVEAPMDTAIQQAQVLSAAGREVAAALRDMGDPSAASAHMAEIDRLEKEGDRLERQALSTLFDAGIDPMAVIRWKDIHDRIEQAIDSCNSVARILQGMAIQQRARA